MGSRRSQISSGRGRSLLGRHVRDVVSNSAYQQADWVQEEAGTVHGEGSGVRHARRAAAKRTEGVKGGRNLRGATRRSQSSATQGGDKNSEVCSSTLGTSRHDLLRLEQQLTTKSHSGGEFRFHLTYPNHYWIGMSNLGFQAVYAILAALPAVEVDRGFLPEAKEGVEARWRTFERDRPLGDCDALGFSLSFETDYPHLVRMLERCNLLSLDPDERARRADSSKFGSPLIIVGGTAATLNPEPVADLVDVIVIGEAEEILEEIVAISQNAKKSGVPRIELLAQLAQVPGVYVPRFYAAEYGPDHTVIGFRHAPLVPERPKRQYVKDLSRFPTHTRILTPETEFRSMFMTETGRGCEMGCRFCVAGYIYRPVRKRSAESLKQTVEFGLKHTDSVGFVGASVSSHRAISELASSVAAKGGRASLSSLMAQKITPELAESLSESEYKTVALAPEAGSERLRRAAGKRVSNETFVSAARELARNGIRGFKLYFIVGLPTEQEQDVDEIASLALRVRDAVVEVSRPSGRVAWVVLSVNPFIPKAVTPFQWESMDERGVLERKVSRVKSLVRGVPNLEMKHETPKESVFQALLSRGDRRVARLLVEIERAGQDWKWLVGEGWNTARAGIPPLDFYVTRRIPFNEVLPWDIVDPLVEKKLLMREAGRAWETLDGGGIDPEEPEEGEMSSELLTRAITG